MVLNLRATSRRRKEGRSKWGRKGIKGREGTGETLPPPNKFLVTALPFYRQLFIETFESTFDRKFSLHREVRFSAGCSTSRNECSVHKLLRREEIDEI